LLHQSDLLINFSIALPDIDWHLEAGLAVVFAEAPAAQRSGPKSQIIKQEWLDLCPIYKALPAAQQ
jgi:iron transport multicopper oxidase